MNTQIRIVAALALALTGAATARAQEPTHEPSPAPTPDPRPVLELSLDQAVERALKNNKDLAVERYRPESAKADVLGAEGAFDYFLTGTVLKNSATVPARNVFSGGEEVNTGTWSWNAGVNKLLPTGGVFDVSFDNNRSNTNNVFTTFNPSYDSSLNLSLIQPLLRNLGMDNSRFQLKVAKNNQKISDTQFQQTVINTVANVKNSYYDIIAAIDNLAAQRRSLSLAQKLLDENQIKVRVGTLAPLDVVQAESEVATREENVIVAEATLAQAEDIVKAAIFPKNDPATWNLRIVPTDRPTADKQVIDTQAAIDTALAKRTDIAVARKQLENNDLSIKLAKSQLLPALNLVAAYGTQGIGGTQLRDAAGEPLPQPITGGYGDALSSVFGRDFPTWQLGVNIAYPLFNKAARAQSMQARISKDQALANLNALEMEIAQEVRSAARDVDANFKRVDSTRAARVLQERRLDAEEKKFAAGMSTNFLVTQAQRDLADANVAEIRAVLAYSKSQIEFQRVQEAGGGGSSTLLVTTQASTSPSGSSSGSAQGSGGALNSPVTN
jgi:outer membrane protein TolC